jgi:hypothetical protein
MSEKLSRREVLHTGATLTFLTVVAAACGKETKAVTCTDTSGLAAGDVVTRNSLGYVDVTTEPGKTCAGCQQYVAGAPDACGTCKVVKGPINPKGYCKAYVAKVA